MRNLRSIEQAWRNAVARTLVAAGVLLFVASVPASAQRCVGQDCNKDRSPQAERGNQQLFYPRPGPQQHYYPPPTYPRDGSQKQLFYPQQSYPPQSYRQPAYPQQIYPQQVYPLQIYPPGVCVVSDVGTCQVFAPPGSYCECRNDFGEVFGGIVQ